METGSSFIAIVLLLAINGFFVAAEFALVKARGFRIEALAASGSAAARLTVRIQARLEAYLAACQLGITMASLGLGWVGEPAVAALLEPAFESLGVPPEALHTSAFITGFLIFSSLHIVVGEQVPKTFAIRMAEPVSLWVAYPLHISYLLVWPLNWLLNKATSSLLGLFGVQEAGHSDVMSGDELKGLVATSREHGELKDDKADMLHNLFEFDQRQVGRVMIPRNSIHALDINGTPEETLEVIRSTVHSRFPVIDGAREDAIVGIVLAKDIHRAMLAGEQAPWRELQRFCREALVVPEYQRVSELFELMRTERDHMAVVVDEYGVFVGIVTLEDLLEEIVGEIRDETDDAEAPESVAAIGDRQWQADGLASLGDVERVTGLSVPDDLDANTLSGLFMQHLARMPLAGETITVADYALTVIDLVDRRVGRVVIECLPEPDLDTATTVVDAVGSQAEPTDTPPEADTK